jgi:hypothetical protein
MTTPKAQTQLLPPRAGETDDELRLREAINRLGGQFLATIDAAIKFRTAPGEAQKARHTARAHLRDAGLLAMHALVLTGQPEAE